MCSLRCPSTCAYRLLGQGVVGPEANMLDRGRIPQWQPTSTRVHVAEVVPPDADGNVFVKVSCSCLLILWETLHG